MVQWKVIALCGLVFVAAAAAVGRSGPQEQSEFVPALKPLVAASPLEKVEADLGQPTAAPPAKCCACSWDQLALRAGGGAVVGALPLSTQCLSLPALSFPS